MASRPWYYVKGRRDLIEKQISKRREKIASRNAVNLQNNDYFNKWQFQNQMIEFDLERIKQVRITEVGENGCILVRQHPKFVCCGDSTGKVKKFLLVQNFI